MTDLHDDKVYESFLKELDADIHFRSCNGMVPLLGACLERPNVCIIREFIEGGTLRTWIHGEEKKLGLSETLQIGRDLAAGLSVMHPNFVHRDLKPDNILMDKDGRPKIIDFGLARYQANPLLTDLSTGVGTPAYMAPEIMEGKVSPKADIYALGILLNECLTRERPFHDYENPAHIIFAVSYRSERPALPQRPEACSCPMLLELITRCWDQDPRRRPTAVEVHSALEHMICPTAVITFPESSRALDRNDCNSTPPATTQTTYLQAHRQSCTRSSPGSDPTTRGHGASPISNGISDPGKSPKKPHGHNSSV
mmetsp:Transcript_37919/g.107143  ORF Transcript_37919/g.107143 Transcript_37919/m.107143 type:complete len:311 (+) Transcript_37919:1191-2123(+)